MSAELTRPLNSGLQHKILQLFWLLAGALYALNGLALLFSPRWFFRVIGDFPPYNRHYMGDLGSFLLPLGIGLIFASRSPGRHAALLWTAAAASLLHALNHLFDAAAAGLGLEHLLLDSIPLAILGLLAIAAAWRGRLLRP